MAPGPESTLPPGGRPGPGPAETPGSAGEDRRYGGPMPVMVLGGLTVVLTTLRSWPQFVRIARTRQRTGVSTLTWTIALANHTGWLAFGLLSGVPLLVVVNLLSGAGCAATVWALRSWRPVAASVALTTAGAVAAFSMSDALLLGATTCSALAMFVPQLVRTLRHDAPGVSPAAWATAALASTSWLAYAVLIDRPSIVIAHCFMLPASLAILARSLGTRPAPRCAATG